MTDLTPAMEAALDSDRVWLFGAVLLDLNDGRQVALVDGARQVTFDPDGSGLVTFKGEHAQFGTMVGLEPPDDGAGDQAPNMSLDLAPAKAADAVDLAQPGMQGSRVRLWLGAIDPTTRQVIADPYKLFEGQLDQPTLKVTEHGRTLALECVSAFVHLFRNEEANRLSHTFHQAVWPGETGLAGVSGISRTVLWGPGERPSSVRYIGESRGGGGRTNPNPGAIPYWKF